MYRGKSVFLPCLLIIAVGVSGSVAQAQGLTARRVQTAIDRAVSYLLGDQQDNGGWPDYSNYPDGVTSLVTLSLVNAGVDPASPELSRALRYLESRELKQTYTVSLQTMVFCATNPNRYANQIRRNAEWLMESQTAAGGWSYNADNIAGPGDPSNSQFALLALHEAQRVGVKFPRERWQKVFGRAKNYWERLQLGNGSFPYGAQNPRGRGSMTCAGIASLLIAGSQLDDLEATADQGIECCGRDLTGQSRIEAAIEWLAANFEVRGNPNFTHYHLYYIYALERVGRLTGRRFIGGHDWYREGAAHLVSMQDQITGSFSSRQLSIQGNSYSETAFALLFLAKGKRQIVVNRLQFGETQDWNNHRMAIQNLTAHTEQAWKRELTWQTVDLRQATVEDLLQAPVLFMSGTRAPRLSRREKLLLKDYVEQGGFLFAEACIGNGCDGQEFEEFFKRLVVELFDQPLEKLSPDHPLWYAESRVRPSDLPDGAWLYGVQTCCRLGVVYCPSSLSCRWHLNQPYGMPKNYPDAIQNQLDSVTRLGINVLSYATGKELKQKLDLVTVLEDVSPQTPTERGVFFLPTLLHNAGADDAPHATSNLVEWMNKENPFRLSSEKRLVDIETTQLEQYPMIFVQGRGKLRLSQAEREALRDYLNNGGFLLANSICADPQFTESFRSEMAIILGEQMTDLPNSHPLLTDRFYGFDVRKVSIIDPTQAGEQIVGSRRQIAPRLEVGRADNRICVVFSPLDLSCALESRHSLQCRGYVREDAARIGINAILFALQN